MLSLENSRNIFRLAAALCLLFVVKPDFGLRLQRIQAAQHGIGGGSLSVEDAESAISDVLPETAAIEQEVFRQTTLLYDSHEVQKGENISELAISLGLNQDTIISVNKITNTRLLQIGKVLKIPNQDGILHNVRSGDTLGSIAEKYKVETEAVASANELFSDSIRADTDLFIPGARLDWVRLQEINGDLFIWPVSGAITSPYGYRRDPFNGSRRQFHTGLDIRGSTGTPIKAAMSGRVSKVGYDDVLGNYVMISHHSGYRTLYGHMSVVRVKTGAYVGTGERIGDVGSTGLSTGPHLHFMVYKNGAMVNPRALIK